MSIETVGDVGSFAIVIGTLTEVLPSVAAFLSIIWVSLRIYISIKEIRDKAKK